MSRTSLQLAICLLLLGRPASAAVSTWDESQLRLLRQYSTPLRWDNVEHSPEWVSGPKPKRKGWLHLIRLRPAEEIVLRGSANTWLRLVGQGKTLSSDDLEIGLSTDGRAFAATVPISTKDHASLLIALPQDKPALIRLTPSPRCKSQLKFAAFFSREEPFAALAPYRSMVGLPGKSTPLRRDDEAASEPTRLLEPGQSIDLSVNGPARLQIVARLGWQTTEALHEESCEVEVQLDQAVPIPLILSPELDGRHRTLVNHSIKLVSNRMDGFIDVPEGKHSLRLQPTARVYLSVFREPDPDFLLPWLNTPSAHSNQVLHPFFVTGASASLIDSPSVFMGDADFVHRQQEAFRLAGDNRPLDAGAQAADWLDRISQTRPDYPAARLTSENLWRQRNFYREVQPTDLAFGQPVRQALFSPTRLLDLFEPQWPVAVFNPTLEQTSGALVQGAFAPVTRSSGLTYELPVRSYDSVLRIAALSSGTSRTRFSVQFDQQTPFAIVLDPSPAVPADELEPSSAFATLRIIERAPEVPATFAAGLPIEEFDLPLPIISPGIVEMRLPQGVRRVRLYAEHQDPPITASVAYRAAKPFELGEAGYLALLSRYGATAAFQMVSNPQTVLESQSTLQNQFLPLIRLFRSHSNDFAKSIELSSPTPSNRCSILPENIPTLTASAQNFEKSGDLIDALGVWNRLFWGTPASGQGPITLAIMRNLQSLGEESLAEQYARVALLNSPGAQIPSEALALLEKSARQADDTEQLEQLRTLVFLRCPCQPHLAGVAEALTLNSCDEMSLMCGLLLPAAQRPFEPLLAAALHLNWWQTFDRLVEELPNDDAKEFWRAQKQLAFFHFAEAERHFKQAGTRGAETLEALRQGRRIRTQLSASSLSERFDALLAWEDWLSHQPGPRIQQTVPEIVSECSGTEALFNCELNEIISFSRADPGRPLKLRFLGPASLQIEARPVLEVPFQQPVDDWVEVAEYGLTNRAAICQCIPNPTLQFVTGTNRLVGIKSLVDLDWGPGWHEVEVGLRTRTGLIRIRRAEPVLPLRILPALSPERMEFVLRAGGNTRSNNKPSGVVTEVPDDAARKARLELLLSPHERSGQVNRPLSRESGIWWVSPALAHQTAPPRGTADLETSALTRIQNLRLALRVPLEPGPAPDFDTRDLEALPLNEQWLAACRWKRWSDFTGQAALPDTDLASYRLATGRVREVLDSNSPRPPLQRLTTLLQVSELFPAWREEAQCLAELLAAQTNLPPGFKKILMRVTQKRTWDPLAIRPLSARIQSIKVQSDWPQDPSLRIRRALLPEAATNQFTIADQSVCTVNMVLQHPAEVRVGAELARAGFSPVFPLTVSLQIDGFQTRHFALTALLPAVDTNFTLLEGPHLVRMWIEDPVANQCVRMSLSGAAGELTNTIWAQSFADMAGEKRFFSAATDTEPIRFSWTGPAFLRIDEWLNGALLSQYRFVPPGEQAIALPPSPGRTQSWFQVFVRGTQTNQPDTRLAWSTREPERVPSAQLVLPESAPLPQAQLEDYYRLGGQEDGTWTASGLLAHRYPFEPGGKQINPLNEFFQASAAYRQAAPSETLWFDTEAFGRVHRQGDVTLGLSEYIEGHPQVLPFEWSWSADGFLGWVDPHQSETEGSFYTTLEIGQRRHLSRKLDWYPFAGLFAHYLSLYPAKAKPLTYLDQDLYTTYRYNHLWGGVLGNELDYKPWLDTALKANLNVTGNENFSVDHWAMVYSLDQLLGPFRAEVAYLFTQWLADSNRKTSSFLQGVSAGLYGELWLNGCNRLEVGGQYRHDWPGSGDSYFVVISWDFSQGRGYRDYSPQKTKFADLRSRRIPAAFNNSFQPDLPFSGYP